MGVRGETLHRERLVSQWYRVIWNIDGGGGVARLEEQQRRDDHKEYNRRKYQKAPDRHAFALRGYCGIHNWQSLVRHACPGRLQGWWPPGLLILFT